MSITEYNKCVDAFSDGVYRFVLKHLKDTDSAQDIVQDTYLKLWEKHSQVDANKAKSYIFSTAYHTMIDYIRKFKHTVLVDDSDFSMGPIHAQHTSRQNEYFDLKKVLDMGLEQLPAIQKSVVLLRDYEGYSYQEIGEITGLGEAQVKVYIYRARQFLKNFIVRMDVVV